MYKVGKCLIQKRMQIAGISQQQLADRLNMPISQISDYKSGRRKMSLATAKTISAALKCTIEDLYEFIEEK